MFVELLFFTRAPRDRVASRSSRAKPPFPLAQLRRSGWTLIERFPSRRPPSVEGARRRARRRVPRRWEAAAEATACQVFDRGSCPCRIAGRGIRPFCNDRTVAPRTKEPDSLQHRSGNFPDPKFLVDANCASAHPTFGERPRGRSSLSSPLPSQPVSRWAAWSTSVLRRQRSHQRLQLADQDSDLEGAQWVDILPYPQRGNHVGDVPGCQALSGALRDRGKSGLTGQESQEWEARKRKQHGPQAVHRLEHTPLGRVGRRTQPPSCELLEHGRRPSIFWARV